MKRQSSDVLILGQRRQQLGHVTTRSENAVYVRIVTAVRIVAAGERK